MRITAHPNPREGDHMPEQADADTTNSDQTSDGQIVNLYEAKTQLSRLVDRAAAGDDIVIARQGRPLVRLIPVDTPRPSGGPTLADIHDRLAAIERALGIPAGQQRTDEPVTSAATVVDLPTTAC